MYTKFQIASQYFPDRIDNPDSAVRRLVRWIDNNRGLMSALQSTGYVRTQHHFTAAQTQLIFDYLGEP